MASNGVAAQQAFAPVLAALATLQGNVERTQKSQAHDFLERFQKSVSLPRVGVSPAMGTNAPNLLA